MIGKREIQNKKEIPQPGGGREWRNSDRPNRNTEDRPEIVLARRVNFEER